ncbi:MAG: hypothetical protein NTW28_02555 [Candidatus Solibacter sp.]|nr:hypothetical protein [Candidatus Solibacter sp.]
MSAKNHFSRRWSTGGQPAGARAAAGTSLAGALGLFGFGWVRSFPRTALEAKSFQPQMGSFRILLVNP